MRAGERLAKADGSPDPYPLGTGVLRIDEHKPEDYERRIITQLREGATEP
jgi:hypothetical protein